MKLNIKIALRDGRVLRVREEGVNTFLFDKGENVGEVECWIHFDDWNDSSLSVISLTDMIFSMLNRERVGFTGTLNKKDKVGERIMGLFILQDSE